MRIANYGPATVNLYSVSLWDALKFEVFNVQEEDLAVESLTTLAAIAKCVAENEACVEDLSCTYRQGMQPTPTRRAD